MKKAIGHILLLLLCLVMGSTAHAQTFPALSGRVVDQANLLSPEQEAALTAKLQGLETRTNRQLVVATLSSLQGYDIADYGYQLGRYWKLGQDGKGDGKGAGAGEAEKDNGTILIIAPNEKKMRIEVGYGLEPVLTDGYASSVIRNTIRPFFKAGDFPGGINAGIDKIITQIELPPEQAAKIAAQAGKQRQNKGGGINVGTVIFWLFLFVFFILPTMRSMSRGGRQHSRSGYGGPVVIWGGGDSFGGGGGSSWGGGGGFGGGGGSFGGGGASGGW